MSTSQVDRKEAIVRRLPVMEWFDTRMPTQQALDQACDTYRDVPAGWRPLLRQALRRVIAARTPEREAPLRYLSAEWDGIELRIDTLFPDDVLAGIARKVRMQSRFTCRTCGRTGRVRHFDMEHGQILCAACAAKPLLIKAIDDVTELAGVLTARGEARAGAVPEVLRPMFASWPDASRGIRGACQEARMRKDAFNRWLLQLARVKAALACTPCESA